MGQSVATSIGDYYVYVRESVIHSIAVVDTKHPYAEVMKDVWTKSTKFDMRFFQSLDLSSVVIIAISSCLIILILLTLPSMKLMP